MTITPLPAAPNRNQTEDDFVATSDAFLAALPTMVTQINSTTLDIEADELSAATSASNAATSETNAAASAAAAASVIDVPVWVSGASYIENTDAVISPVNQQTYRAKTTHSGLTTDPSADTTNWTPVTGDITTALLKAGGTMTGPLVATSGITVNDVTETVFELTGTDVDPSNGTVQTITMTANRTLTESLVSGQAVRILITDGDLWALTYPVGTKFVGGVAPVFTGLDMITMEKIGTHLIVYAGLGIA